MAGGEDYDDEEYYKATIAGLVAENRQLRQDNQAASSERDSLSRDLDSKREEIRNLYEETLREEKAREEVLGDLCEEKKARHSIAESHGYLERRIDRLHEEFTSVILSALAVQADLEERFERKAKALRFLSEKVRRMLRWTRETVCGKDGTEGSSVVPVDDGDRRVDDEGMRTMIEPFVVEAEKIRSGLLRRGIGSQIDQSTKRLCF